MKTRTTLAAILISTILFSCDSMETITPDNNVTIEQKEFTDYTRIEAEAAFTVYVNFSNDEEKIEIEANENLHQYIEVTKDDGALKIKIKDNINISGSSTLKAYVTTKQVTGYSATGASMIILNDLLDAEDANIFLSGASNFTGELEVSNIDASIDGASNIYIEGLCDNLDVAASGASTIRTFEFNCDFVKLTLSGASSAELTINESLDVVASGASNVRYKGNATVNSQDLSGESKIIKVN